jgi:hypothetical protein
MTFYLTTKDTKVYTKEHKVAILYQLVLLSTGPEVAEDP